MRNELIWDKLILMNVPIYDSLDDARRALGRLTMTEFRTLLAIKTAGTLSRAAVALGVSQPALSQHVRDMESKLGVPMFVRGAGGMTPTAYGDAVWQLAASLRADIGVAAEALWHASRNDKPPLRIGSMSVTSGGILAVALGRYASEAANPACVLVEGSREVLLEHLHHRRIDMFVGRLADDEPPSGLLRETLFQDSCVVISSLRHPLARKNRLNMEALYDHSWIVPAEDTSFYKQIAESMRRAGVAQPEARIASYSMLALAAVVSTSELLGFLPMSLYASGTLSNSVRRLEVDLAWTPSPLGIVMWRDASLNPRAQRLLEILRAVAGSARASAPHA
ncbi:HTH-type transcriptional regulator HdfR [Achromobacter pulmonis]|uniref:HTH-type transcriptional regulator HdfR n=2 Tax=Achromobacter pulmonis TaxID=1389932 RepID=A0A6S7DPU2_9BURK|nr:HTH-type transcriptional regulator HdfR [Achromobacter pulmonis]